MNSLIISLLFLVLGFISFAQSANTRLLTDFDDNPRGRKAARIMFYNVENLFDTKHDTLKYDQQFLPEGDYRWDKNKYWNKQKKIAQVITAVGGWEMPAIVGLAEIENKHTLINLCYNTQLKSTNYQTVHHESPDRRGIDVVFLYRREKFILLFDSAISIRFPFDTTSRTRDILYVKGVLLDADTIHFVVTHWPSKYGGAFVTIPKRVYVAQQIRKLTDSIISINSNAKIIIMGDLNDAPDEESLIIGLKAVLPDSSSNNTLFNLMLPLSKAGKGSHFYKGPTGAEWNYIDQFVVSRELFQAKRRICLRNSKAYVFKASFLLEQNESGLDIPFRTYIGRKYHGGFSDHLPIYLDVEVLK
ncbi:MAG: endonuclease [Bacteroidales bacterium]|nr:endonuclease [Bacteroidales bacterium]